MKIKINCCGGSSPKCKCYTPKGDIDKYFISMNSLSIPNTITNSLTDYLTKEGIPFSYETLEDDCFVKIYKDTELYTIPSGLSFGEYMTLIHNYLYEKKYNTI
jgi:hypothetical protein